MWIIAGTLPVRDMPLEYGPCRVTAEGLALPSGRTMPVERGTATLAAATALACRHWGLEPPCVLLAGDCGAGDGSRLVYRYLTEHAAKLHPAGLTFHYLFPDVDWHNKVLLAVQALEPRPVLVADAGFMYVAKMSGYADEYTLFTPDAGEMAFLADECAPHPFYTRGFLLDEEADIPQLVARSRQHGNCPPHLIIKGAVDHLVRDGEIIATVDAPSVPAMEAVGGTGDLITALVTAFLMRGAAAAPVTAVDEASLHAARCGRRIAALAQPTPATQIRELLTFLPQALDEECG